MQVEHLKMLIKSLLVKMHLRISIQITESVKMAKIQATLLRDSCDSNQIKTKVSESTFIKNLVKTLY